MSGTRNVVVGHTDIEAGRQLALVPYDEVTTRDWEEIVLAIKTVNPKLDEAQYQRSSAFGSETDYRAMLADFAISQKWMALEIGLLVALDADSPLNADVANSTQRPTRHKLNIHLYSNGPMCFPSISDSLMRADAVEKAKTVIQAVKSPVVTFIEHANLGESGLGTLTRTSLSALDIDYNTPPEGGLDQFGQENSDTENTTVTRLSNKDEFFSESEETEQADIKALDDSRQKVRDLEAKLESSKLSHQTEMTRLVDQVGQLQLEANQKQAALEDKLRLAKIDHEGEITEYGLKVATLQTLLDQREEKLRRLEQECQAATTNSK